MGQTVKQKMIAISKKNEGISRIPFGELMGSNPPIPPKAKPKPKKK